MTRQRETAEHPLRVLLRQFAHYRGGLMALVGLGLLSSLAETFGITLVVLLLTVLLGADTAAFVGTGGILGRIYGFAFAMAGGRTGVLGGIVFLLILARSACNFVYALVTSHVRHAMSEEVRNRIHAAYLDLSYDFVRRRDTGQLFNTLSADSWALADASQTVAHIVTTICSIGVFTAFLLAVSVKLTLIAAVGSLLMLLLVGSFGGRTRELSEEVIAVNIALADKMLANMQGMRAIRAFAREAAEKASFAGISKRARDGFTSIDRLHAVLGPVTELASLGVLAVVVWSAAPIGVSMPATLTAVLLLYRLQPLLRELENNRLAMVGHEPSLRLIQGILDADDRRSPALGHLPFHRLKQSIVFEDVSFGYEADGLPVLHRMSCTIPARGVTAIAGPSGSGKTTFINLLLRLYQPDSGRILVDGVPLNDLRRTDWLGRLALAGQDAELIAGSIGDNIRLARPDAPREAVWEAAELAGIGAFIRDLPDGLDTLVGDRGINMSGGQRQRIGLARALLCDPDVLILDEATNALEDRLERRIHERLRSRYSDRAIILITHRTTGLPAADQVIHVSPPSTDPPPSPRVKEEAEPAGPDRSRFRSRDKLSSENKPS